MVKAATVFLRDHSVELSKEEQSWCIELIRRAVCTNANSEIFAAITDNMVWNGATASASVLPLILDFASEEKDTFYIKKIIATALTHANMNVCRVAANAVREYLWQKDPDFAQKCIIGTIEYARLIPNMHTPVDSFQCNNSITCEPNEWLEDFRERLAYGNVTTDTGQITFHSHSPKHLLVSYLMIPNGSAEPLYISLFSQMLAMFIEVENAQNLNEAKKKNETRNHYEAQEVQEHFERRFAEYLFSLLDPNVQQIFLEKLRVECNTAPSFTRGVLFYIQVSAKQARRIDRYWWFWDQLSEHVQQIAILATKSKSRYHYDHNKRSLIRGMLYADLPRERVRCDREEIVLGKKSISKFVINAGANPDVFEAMTSLMFHFPEDFFELGLTVLAEHLKKNVWAKLVSSNAAFYLERGINNLLLSNNMATMSRTQYMSCQILLDAIVETGSSSAYYLREQLIRYRKIEDQTAKSAK